LKICARAAAEKLPVYFYGSTHEILIALRQFLRIKFPGILIAGVEPSKFRRLSQEERNSLVERIRNSGASIVFVGLGCPRQEIFAYEFRNALPMPVLAVGAAFPFLAGFIPQAPSWMQNAGLEWMFRLISEPRRLWCRYAFLNPAYVFLVGLQGLGVLQFNTVGRSPAHDLLYG
jgi:N-acetylglucosaminyldiphosphoundecaprenol N-acetyl-beta-D-mannosaminyltransferase